MRGYVNEHLEVVVEVTVRGPRGEQRIEAIIDTGYDGVLTLPEDVIRALEIPFDSHGIALLGDGSRVSYKIYEGEIAWGGEFRVASIDAAETEPLVGTALLADHELRAEFIEHGSVSLKALS